MRRRRLGGVAVGWSGGDGFFLLDVVNQDCRAPTVCLGLIDVHFVA